MTSPDEDDDYDYDTDYIDEWEDDNDWSDDPDNWDDDDDDFYIYDIKELSGRERERNKKSLRDHLKKMRRSRLQHLQRMKKDPRYRFENAVPF